MMSTTVVFLFTASGSILDEEILRSSCYTVHVPLYKRKKVLHYSESMQDADKEGPVQVFPSCLFRKLKIVSAKMFLKADPLMAPTSSYSDKLP